MIKNLMVFIVLALFMGGCLEKQQQKIDNPYEKLTQQEKFQALTQYLVQKGLRPPLPNFPQKPNERLIRFDYEGALEAGASKQEILQYVQENQIENIDFEGARKAGVDDDMIFEYLVTKPNILKAKELVKGKYEKLADFEARVEQEKKKRATLIASLEKEYAQKVKEYNQEVQRLTDSYNNELAKREKERENIILQAMQKAYVAVYGTPFVDKNLKYDPETERFFAQVTSTKGGFSEKVAIDVPLSEAEAFETNIANVKTNVVFSFENNNFMLKKIELQKEKKTYLAMLSDVNFKADSFRVAVGGQEQLQLAKIPFLSASLNVSEADYALGNINYSKDPEIAQLQKKKYELEKAQRDQKK